MNGREKIAAICGTALTATLALSTSSAGAATLTAIDDTIILANANSSATSDNYGGRSEIILGGNTSTAQPRHGLFRFDVSGLASQINANTQIASATLTLTEVMTRDGNNGSTSHTLSAYGIVAANKGWVEGTANGGGAGPAAGSASYRYHTTNSQNWASGPNVFTFGTDTGASLGSGTVQFATGSQQTLVITLDPTALQALLTQWLADGTSNAGLAIQSTGNKQLFFESIETGVSATPATLDITFVPEPGSLAILGLGGLLIARRRRA